jgi:acetyl-CoA C-acetyltransferase
MSLTEVVIVGAARTPIGRYGGAFRSTHPAAEVRAFATRAALDRSGIDTASVDDVWIGHARQAGSGPNPARQVVRRAGLPDAVPAQTINKACASGLQANASGAQSIALGESDIVVAGGIESMSRMPYLIDSEDARWGHRMDNPGERHWEILRPLARDGQVSGPLVIDAALAAIAIEHGATLCTTDRGFARFPGLTWMNPIASR